MQLPIFYIVVLTLFTVFHLYVGRRLISASNLPKAARRIGWGLIGVVYVIQFVAVITYRTWSEPLLPGWLHALMWTAYSLMGLLAFMLIITFLRDIALLLLRVYRSAAPKESAAQKSAPAEKPQNPARRKFLSQGAAFGIVGLSGGLTGFGMHEATKAPRLIDVEVPIRNLPAELNGFRILQISDLHVGPTIGRAFVEDVVQIANKAQADLIVNTGDMVDGTVAQIGDYVEPLKDLHAPNGLFFVTGNHEYYWNAASWVDFIRSLGFDALINEHRIIEKNGGRFALGGVTDVYGGRFKPSHRSDPKAAFAGSPDGVPRILLAHQPRSIYASQHENVQLQLSGHTHGGQFYPWNFFVRLQQPYVAGLYKHENTWVYVNRATGYWGPPMRLGSFSEITRATLRRSDDAIA